VSAPDLARELRERLTDARALAGALGLRIARGATPRQAMVLCPWHGERSPSCSVWLAKDGTIAVKCHACGATGTALDLIAQVQGLDDFRATLRAAAEIANAPSLAPSLAHVPRQEAEHVSDEDYHTIATYLLDACPLDGAPHVARYLDTRGVYADADAAGVRGLPRDPRPLVALLLATFERANLERAGVLRRGHDALDWPAWCVCIPWRDRFGRITCVQRRRLDAGEPKYRFPAGRAPHAPFGVEHLAAALEFDGPDAEIVITEGAIDCLARRRVARHRGERCAVIGVYSASSACVGLPLDLLARRHVVLALDDDEAGERACTALATELHGLARELVRERPTRAKDWGATIAEVRA
jgi:DNA primase